MEHMQIASRAVATEPKPRACLRTDDALFCRKGITLASCERVTEPPWYVIRTPGGVTGTAREGLPMSISPPDQKTYCMSCFLELSYR